MVMVVTGESLANAWVKRWPAALPIEDVPLVRHINDNSKTIATSDRDEVMGRQRTPMAQGERT